MGSTELRLLLMYGVPLAVKLLRGGKDEKETVDAVTNAIVNLDGGDIDVGKTLLAANKEESKNIIDGLFDVITGVADAFGNLIGAFARLLGG